MPLLPVVDVVVIAWLMRVCGRKLRNNKRLLEEIVAVLVVVGVIVAVVAVVNVADDDDGDRDEDEDEDEKEEVGVVNEGEGLC